MVTLTKDELASSVSYLSHLYCIASTSIYIIYALLSNLAQDSWVRRGDFCDLVIFSLGDGDRCGDESGDNVFCPWVDINSTDTQLNGDCTHWGNCGTSLIFCDFASFVLLYEMEEKLWRWRIYVFSGQWVKWWLHIFGQYNTKLLSAVHHIFLLLHDHHHHGHYHDDHHHLLHLHRDDHLCHSHHQHCYQQHQKCRGRSVSKRNIFSDIFHLKNTMRFFQDNRYFENFSGILHWRGLTVNKGLFPTFLQNQHIINITL